MALPTQPYKGARDFYPEDKRLQKYMFGKLRQTVELFGYEEYDAPILEPLELYAAKSGEEIVNEQTYTFQDRGGRQVAIRPEMTPTVSRMVAGRRQELAYPLRWYSLPNLWRYERPQRGRLRENWQLNVDSFGVDDLAAEQELIQIGNQLLRGFGATPSMFEIRINHRQLIDAMLRDYMGFDAVQCRSLAKLIDRMAKMEPAAFEAHVDALCTPLQREKGDVAKLLQLLTAKRIQQLPAELQNHAAAKQIFDLLESLPEVGIHNARFDLSLMRGFDYYTGIVFEVFDTNPSNNRSMFGGGRYDGLVGLFGVEPVPTAGFGMGDVTLQNFLESHDLLPKIHPETDLYIGILSDKAYDPAQKVVQEMRDNGLRVAIDTSGRKIDKMLKTADKKGIRHALFIGERELESQQYELRDLTTGQTENHGVARIISLLEDYRRR